MPRAAFRPSVAWAVCGGITVLRKLPRPSLGTAIPCSCRGHTNLRNGNSLSVTSVLVTLLPDHSSLSGICKIFRVLGSAEVWLVIDRDLELGSSRMPSSIADVTKRRWPRFGVDFPVQVRLTTQGPTKVVACKGQGTDISGGGLAVRADIDLPIGAQVGVEFTPPYSDQPMIFRSFVRNRDGNLYGVEFITENDEDYRKAGGLQAGLAAMNADVPIR